jgi:nucleoside-diphosphate-sugar epimerase
MNLSDAQELRIAEIAPRIIALTDSRSEVGFLLLAEDDRRQRRPNTDYARRILKWKPSMATGYWLEQDN